MNTRRTYSGQPFTVLVGLRPTLRTIRFGQIRSGNKITNGLLRTDIGGVAGANGSFEVTDNDFSTGRVELFLGDYSLVSNVDYAIGGNVGATATNIAAAISLLPGFLATANVAVVTVTYYASANDLTFKADHYGTVQNLTSFTPDSGLMQWGSPAPAGVLLG